MSFYQYRQNNSGGSFEVNDKLTVTVWIEARCVEEANNTFQSLGGYFDGCEKGWDCECCGDRWYPVDEGDCYETLPEIELSTSEYLGAPAGSQTVVHYLDGGIVWK
jgi:hypothetical protein